MWVFKKEYWFAFVAHIIINIIRGICPILVSEIINCLQSRDESRDCTLYCIFILVVIAILMTVQYFVYSHDHRNNLQTGHFTKKILVTMTINKQLRMIPSLSKNYEVWQIMSVRAASDMLLTFCDTLVEWVMQPLWFAYTSIRLYMIIGPTYFISLIILVICCQVDTYYYGFLDLHKSERRKLREERYCMIKETFENIRTVKLYCLENRFKKHISQIRAY